MKIPSNKATIAAARRLYHDEGVIEIDECQIDECEEHEKAVSRAEGNPNKGAYVMAWVWVPDEATKKRGKSQQRG